MEIMGEISALQNKGNSQKSYTILFSISSPSGPVNLRCLTYRLSPLISSIPHVYCIVLARVFSRLSTAFHLIGSPLGPTLRSVALSVGLNHTVLDSVCGPTVLEERNVELFDFNSPRFC